MKHHNCNCDILDKPSYHASDDPHSVGKKWVCPVHGKQEKTWLIHTEKQEYCKPCQEAPEKQTCKFHPNGCINDGIHAEVPKQNIAATQQGNESVKIFTYEGSAFEAPTDDIEKLSSILHDIYQKEAHRQEAEGIGPARHYDEYEKLSEPVKEFDRVLARYIIELLQKERERGIAEGRADEAIFCHEHKGGGYEAGKSEAFSLVKKMIEEELQGRFAFNGGLQHLLSELSTLEGK